MVDKRRCPRCRCVHFEDELCDCLPGASERPAPDPQEAAPEPVQEPPRAKLPRYDPLMQEAEDRLARRFGKAAAQQMIDDEECDDINGGMRR